MEVAVESRAANLRQLAHSLDAQVALQPRLGFHRRRLLAREIVPLTSSPYFLQGTSEKTISTVLSASNGLSLLISLRSVDSLELCEGNSPSASVGSS